MTPTTDTSREARAEAAYDAALIAEGDINVGSGFARRTALRAMLAFATAEQQRVPDSNLQKTQSAGEAKFKAALEEIIALRENRTLSDAGLVGRAHLIARAALQPHEVKP